MKGKLIVLLLTVICHIPSVSIAGSDDLMTLYTSAKANDPGIGKSQSRLEANRADTRIALSQLLPRIEANAGISWLSSTSLNYGPREISGSYTGDTYGASARLPLLQMPSIFNVLAAKASVKSADAALSGSRQDLIIAVLEAYIGTLKSQADEVLYKEELKRVALLHDQAVEFKASGTGSVLAILEAKAKRDSAAADSIKATIGRKIAFQQLENVVGRQVSEVKDFGTINPMGPEPSDIGWWITTMEQNQPNLVQARELVSQSELQRRAIYAGHLPTITASGGYSVNKGSTFLPEVETRQWSVGFNVSLPIYSGGETNARVERALAAESEQRHVLNGVHDQAVQKLKQAYLNLEYSLAVIPSLQQKMSSAVIQLDAVKDGRSVGTRTGVDLINADQSVAVAKRDLTSALYDNILRQLQLKAAAGILNERDLDRLNINLAGADDGEKFVAASKITSR